MICSQPAIAAPCTTFRPTPPAPITATRAPRGTCPALITAPTPVTTAQPMRRQRFERHVGRHRNRAVFRHDDEVGEARGAEKRRDVLPARMQPRGAGRQLVAEGHFLDAVAQHRAPLAARRAHAARGRPAQHDVIAGLHAA